MKKLKALTIRLLITIAVMLFTFTYGVIQSIHTLGHIGDFKGLNLLMVAMSFFAWYGSGQVIKELKEKRKAPCGTAIPTESTH